MKRKVGAGTAAVSREALSTAVKETNTEPLPRAAAGNQELEDELLLIEMRLLRAMRLRHAQALPARKAAAPASRTKDKIVRSLRRKK